MSEDGFSDSFEEPNIEIQIKTLMGTTFDIKVSSNDTVGTIKKKIYRVEGIPVYQQNLLFQSKELKDTTRLCDLGLKNGSTLILVSSMRGGPITTRKLSVTSEHYLLKELKDLFENSKEEMCSKSKVSVFVFKKGDIINLLRVIENEDGSYSPYNETVVSSPSKSSPRDKINVFERLVEDTEMCTKLATLRKNMEELNIKKKTRSRHCNDDCSTARQATLGGGRSDSDDHANEENDVSYRFLEESPVESLDHFNLTIFENNLFPDEGNQSESEEIALKDKHRTKPKVIQSFPVRKAMSKHIYSERRGIQCHSRQNFSKTSKRREPRLSERFEKSVDGYLTFSRDRHLDKDDYQSSSFMDSKSTVYGDTLPNLDISLGNSCILPSLTNIGNKEVSRLSLKMKSNQNEYLLGGLNCNKLPDLKIMDKDNFLSTDIDDSSQILESNVGRNLNKMNNTDLNIPVPNTTGKSASRFSVGASDRLPNLTSRISSTFGSLMPDLASKNSTTLESRVSNSATLMSSVPLPSNCHLSSGSKISRTRSSITPFSMESASNKQAQPSYSVAGISHLVSESSNGLDTSLSNFTRLDTLGNLTISRGESPNSGATGSTSVEEMSAKLAEQLHLLDDESSTDVYEESLSVPARNRVHLARLVLTSEGAERPKSSPNTIDLEKHTQDVWEIREPASDRLKRSATCKVGLLKRRQEVEYNYDSLENSQTKLKPELGNLGNFSKSSNEFGVCSGSANYYLPKYLAAPSAIPPQYAPKQHPKYCDLFFTDEPRSPLYSRRNSRKENLEKGHISNKSRANVEKDSCSIQRLKNDGTVFGSSKEFNGDALVGHYNLGCVADILERTEESNEEVKLPPVIKKKSRCNHCNKRLNITNIYDCRCEKIFCSQHRYSEVHGCTYDYKTEGRKLLEQQNPLVTAEKVGRF